ncbi:hypothetical protein G3N96_32510 [Burkholderia sp. Se-20373]|nr:hypothetical protein [Burkholderia sp. Se-20373]
MSPNVSSSGLQLRGVEFGCEALDVGAQAGDDLRDVDDAGVRIQRLLDQADRYQRGRFRRRRSVVGGRGRLLGASEPVHVLVAAARALLALDRADADHLVQRLRDVDLRKAGRGRDRLGRGLAHAAEVLLDGFDHAASRTARGAAAAIWPFSIQNASMPSGRPAGAIFRLMNTSAVSICSV